jgi:hypothetical protein
VLPRNVLEADIEELGQLSPNLAVQANERGVLHSEPP